MTLPIGQWDERPAAIHRACQKRANLPLVKLLPCNMKLGIMRWNELPRHPVLTSYKLTGSWPSEGDATGGFVDIVISDWLLRARYKYVRNLASFIQRGGNTYEDV